MAGARAAFERAIDRGSDDAYFTLATVLERQGDMDGADDAMRLGITEMVPRSRSLNPLIDLGQLLERRGRPGWAEAAYQQALEKDTGGKRFWLNDFRRRHGRL